MMKKLMLTAAFAGVVVFLAAGCSSFCKSDCDSCKKCDDKAAGVEKAGCPMKTNCDMKMEAPAK